MDNNVTLFHYRDISDSSNVHDVIVGHTCRAHVKHQPQRPKGDWRSAMADYDTNSAFEDYVHGSCVCKTKEQIE